MRGIGPSTILYLAGIALGGLWLLQGLGVVRWPASSFMIDQSLWSFIGAGLIALCAIGLWRGR